MISTEKARILALASDASYSTDQNPRSLPDMIDNGYEITKTFNDQNNGFNAVVFRKTGTEEYIVAFTGTEGIQDGVADAALGVPQWESNRDNVINYLNTLTISDIDFTGHSLGGALSQYAAYDYLKGKVTDSLMPNVSLATFNGLGGMAVWRDGDAHAIMRF